MDRLAYVSIVAMQDRHPFTMRQFTIQAVIQVYWTLESLGLFHRCVAEVPAYSHRGDTFDRCVKIGLWCQHFRSPRPVTNQRVDFQHLNVFSAECLEQLAFRFEHC